MPELFQIFKSHSGIRKKGGSMDLVHLSGGLLVKHMPYLLRHAALSDKTAKQIRPRRAQ